MQRYTWGDDHAASRASARDMVRNFLNNELDNGPGWVVVHGSDAYDINLHVTLVKKPPVKRRHNPHWRGDGGP